MRARPAGASGAGRKKVGTCGIVNDPNRKDEPAYIIELIGRVVTVSLETNRIVAGLPPLEIAAPE